MLDIRVTDYNRYLLLIYNILLPKQQIEARKKRSTESALETLTDTIYIVFGYSK